MQKEVNQVICVSKYFYLRKIKNLKIENSKNLNQ